MLIREAGGTSIGGFIREYFHVGQLHPEAGTLQAQRMPTKLLSMEE